MRCEAINGRCEMAKTSKAERVRLSQWELANRIEYVFERLAPEAVERHLVHYSGDGAATAKSLRRLVSACKATATILRRQEALPE